MRQEGVIFGGNRDVVHIDPDYRSSGLVFSDGATVQCIHHGLKGSRGVSETEEHYSRFVESSSHFKCCLVFVSCLDANVVIPASFIQLRVNHSPSQVSDQCGDEGKQILVSHRPLIDILVVLHWS